MSNRLLGFNIRARTLNPYPHVTILPSTLPIVPTVTGRQTAHPQPRFVFRTLAFPLHLARRRRTSETRDIPIIFLILRYCSLL